MIERSGLSPSLVAVGVHHVHEHRPARVGRAEPGDERLFEGHLDLEDLRPHDSGVHAWLPGAAGDLGRTVGGVHDVPRRAASGLGGRPLQRRGREHLTRTVHDVTDRPLCGLDSRDGEIGVGAPLLVVASNPFRACRRSHCVPDVDRRVDARRQEIRTGRLPRRLFTGGEPHP